MDYLSQIFPIPFSYSPHTPDDRSEMQDSDNGGISSSPVLSMSFIVMASPRAKPDGIN